MKKLTQLFVLLAFTFLMACSGGDQNGDSSTDQLTETEEFSTDPMHNKGIGPISNIELGELDPAMAAEGEEVFSSKCSACHKAEKRFVGPAMAGVLERRSPEWVMNMILNPEEMVEEDPIAMELLAEYLSPMANQNLSEDEARKILEYFRTL